jgi:flavin-dependent dehydrogenase
VVWDVIIVGAGPAGIFAAIELTRKAPGLSILIIDKGLGLDKRKCPETRPDWRMSGLLALFHNLGMGRGGSLQ